MRLYGSTLVPAIDVERDSSDDAPVEVSFTFAQTLARVSMSVAVTVVVSALFAAQIYTTLR